MQKFYFNTIIKFKTIIVFILILPACNAIFENDITEEELDLIIPMDGTSYTTNQVHFKWNEMEGATNYRLQIVQPNFASIQTFVLDSLVTGSEYFYVLNPGTYQFKIRAENSGYQSAYKGPFTIIIDSVSTLTNQIVQLLSPNTNIYTNSTVLNCTWQSVFAADYYEFELRSGSDFNSSGTTIHNETNIYSTSYNIPSAFLVEGVYAWGVKAHNASSSSAFSARSFSIDLTQPNDVVLTLPVHNHTNADQTVVFKWNTGIDPGTVHSPVFSHIEFGTDTNFTSTLFSVSNIYVDSLQYTFPSAGDIWWRVYAEDEAGNISSFYSPARKVTIP